MRIGVELRQVTFGVSGGIAHYLRGILDAAFRTNPHDQFVVFCTVFSRSLLQEVPSNVTVLTVPGFNFFPRIDQAFESGEIDVLFRSFPMEAPLRMPWHKQVVLIPDLQHEVYPEFFTQQILALRRSAFNEAMARSGALLTFTEYVRGVILANEWNACGDILLAPPALPLSYAANGELSEQERALIPSEDFLLYPANLWPHKNHQRVIEAFARMLSRTNRKVRMVFTGHPEGWDQLREKFRDLPIFHLGFVREQMMRTLLSRAQALPFFSLHEGFGIPLLEAFNAGTPVICSNTTSLPEVGGDAVLSCDPTDIEAVSELMERILSDHPKRAELIGHGKQRLTHYTWERAAAGLMESCKLVASRDRIAVGAEAPLVTIVTPSYNQGRFLKATIESVLTQSYPKIEYMVIDGGSTDESVEILKSYGNRFHWKSEKDGGQADAINQGMKIARGQILAYLNSDDVLLPGAVERAVGHFRENPDCDMIYGRAQYIDAAGAVTGLYRTDEYSFQRLMHDCCVCQPATFWQARIAHKIGPFDESLHCAMDYDYWLRIDRAGGHIHHVHDLLACSRLYPDTKTMSLREAFYKEIFAVCLKHGGYVEYNYFLGLWNHLVNEKAGGWPHFLKPLPGSYIMPAWWHHKLFEYKRLGPRRIGAQVIHQLASRAAALPLAGRAMAVGSRIYRSLIPPARVKGFLPDNWMQPQAEVVLRPKAVGQMLRHFGMAPVDMQVTIESNRRVLGVYPLRGGEVQAIGQDISIRPDLPMPLLFRFSRYTVDSAHRRLSFLVTETNLFGEDDLG